MPLNNALARAFGVIGSSVVPAVSAAGTLAGNAGGLAAGAFVGTNYLKGSSRARGMSDQWIVRIAP